MGQAVENTKDVARRILETVKSIYPQLAEISKQTDFEITISGDKKGVYLEFTMDWDPTSDPEPEDVAIEESINVAEDDKELIKKALQKADGHYKKAAELLGISTRTLKRKLALYNL